MDAPRWYYTKWSQTEEVKYCVISLICGFKKTKQMNKLSEREIILDKENE